MSSLRNAFKRTTHKERAQPLARQRLGILEKKKDYVKRARDFNEKKRRLQNLSERAKNKNPDEFYFGMQNAQIKNGKHVSNDVGASLDMEAVKVLKSQDMNYVNYKAAMESQKISRLQSNLHFLGAEAQNSHTVFVDDEEKMMNFDASEYFDTEEALVSRAYNRPRKDGLYENAVTSSLKKVVDKVNKKRDSAYRELYERIEREDGLRAVRGELQLQKDLAGKGRKKRVKKAKEGQPAIYKWKTERKR